MPNTKATGVAFADPQFESITVTGAASLQAVSSSNGLSILTGTAPAAAAATPVGLKMSSTANLGLFFGTGAPSGTVAAAKGSLYINTTATTTTSRLYINTDGSTTWATFTTSA